jgi:hypothetical protein
MVSRRPNEGRSEETRKLHPFAWRPVLVASAAMVTMLMACAGRYGYHRDELHLVRIVLAGGRDGLTFPSSTPPGPDPFSAR